VLAERPSDDELTGEHAALLEKVRDIAAEQGFDPDHDVTRVGVLYATLYWMFMRSDAPEGPWQQLPTAMLAGQVPHLDDRDIVDPGERLATADEWQAFGRILVLPENVASEPIRDRALKAIFEIGRQGEAPTGPGPGDDSHFELFVTSYEEFDGGSAKDVPTNPFYADAADPEPAREANRISHPRSRAWAELADKRYALLLLDIEKALQLAPTERATVVERTIDEMRVLRDLGDHLTTLPRRDGDDAAHAALCFTILASSGGGETPVQQMARLVRDSTTLADRLSGTQTLPPASGEGVGWETILTLIRELDRARNDELQGAG
jgi:hypothetical protein